LRLRLLFARQGAEQIVDVVALRGRRGRRIRREAVHEGDLLRLRGLLGVLVQRDRRGIGRAGLAGQGLGVVEVPHLRLLLAPISALVAFQAVVEAGAIARGFVVFGRRGRRRG
jgi:hypothetical protein